MAHDFSHLDEAAARVIVKECYGTDPDELTDHPASKSWEPPSWPAWERLKDDGHYARKAIFDALTPSDLAALLAEKCPEFICVTKSPPSSWSWPQQVMFDRATTEAIEAYYPHKQADYAIAQRLELIRQVLQSALEAAPKLGDE